MNKRWITVRSIGIFMVTALLAQLPFLPAGAQPDPGPAREQNADGGREEIERLRTATSKTYRNDDGTKTVQMFSGAVHFLDARGNWREIDTALEDATHEGYAWQNGANAYRASFRRHTTDGFMRFAIGEQVFEITADGASPSATAMSAREHREKERGGGASPEVTPAPATPEPATEAPATEPPATEAPAEEPRGEKPSEPGAPKEKGAEGDVAATSAEEPAGPSPEPSAAPSPEASPTETATPEPTPEPEPGDDLPGKSSLIYDDVFPGVDVEYRLLPDGVKETLILDDASAPARYRFYLDALRDVPVEVEELDNGGWAFYVAPKPEPAFVLAPPYAYDSGPSSRSRDGHASLEVRKVGGRYAVDLSVDAQWLHDQERQFPVYLDPTITIQPPSLDANFIANCSGCTPWDYETIWVGTDSDTWRGAYKFDLSSIPVGANVTDAQFKSYYTGECVYTGSYTCGSTSHLINAHKITSNWSLTTTTSGLTFDPTTLSSFTVPASTAAQWMNWGVTQTVKDWLAGTSPNYGIMLKRATEPANASGPDMPSRQYFETTIRPKLEVTYASAAVTLLEPETLHSNGAELEWTKFNGTGFTSYEVHRGTTATFAPSASTLLTSIGDVATTSFVDATAAPSKSFSYKVVAGGATSNGVTVTLPADGQSKKILQPVPTDGVATSGAKYSSYASCANYGKEPSLYFGTTSTSVWRSALMFDMRDVPAHATVNSADLSLWHPTMVTGDHTINAHRVTSPWKEGSGVSTCTGDGATWYETQGGVKWGAQGGDIDGTPVDSERDWDEPAETDVFNLAGVAQKWVSGSVPNYGIILKRSDETLVDGRRFTYYADDQSVSPTLRPKLVMVYTDGNKAKGPAISVASPLKDTQVSGSAVKIVANASDDRRVDKVEFLVDGALVSTDTAAPWEATWNSTTVVNGTRNLTVRATDDAGNVTTSAAVPVVVGNSAAPTTSISAPALNATVSGTAVTVSANAADDLGVSKVEFFSDGLKFAEDTASPYSVAWNTLDPANPAYDGVHTLTSRVTDSHGQTTTSAGRNVTVSNAGTTKYKAGFTSTAVPQAMSYDPAAVTQTSYPVDVTVKNNSTVSWTGTDLQLRYRWYNPATPSTFVDGTAVAFGTNLAAAGTRTLRVQVQPPPLAEGIDRAQYQLRFDLQEKSTSAYFTAKGNKPLEHPVLINKALKATALGLERYYHYTGESVGAGMGNLVNVANGNSILRWTPFMAPGRGLATVMDITYNSLEDKSDSPIGNNFSLSISSLSRFGLPLDIHPNNADTIAGRSNKWIEFTDGDGTTHRFTQNAGGGWDEPPGVHLFLRQYSTTDLTKKWALTKPDRTTFFYDSEGYPTSVEDRNGNKIVFTLETVPPGEDPGGFKKRITKVTDAAGALNAAPNRSFNIDYYSKAEAHKPHVRGKIQTITDHDGSALDFEYYDDGNLLRLTQRGGTNADGTALPSRTFVFTYTTSDGSGPAIPLAADRVNPASKTPNQSNRLFSVRDARGAETTFTYYGPGSSLDRWKLKSRTNRTGNTTSFAYDNTLTLTTVTAPLSRVSKYDYDSNGRVVQLTNPKNEVTNVAWTPDFHVSKVTEPNGANRQYTYNANGYLTDVKVMDRNNVQITATQLVYNNLAVKAEGGAADTRDALAYWKAGRTIPHVSQLERRIDGRGNAWVFQSDANGNITKVIEPEPAGLPDGSRYSTTYAWNTGTVDPGTISSITDARSKVTSFPTYDANGLATKIVDAKGNTTKFGYTDDGLLEWVQDPEHLQYEVTGHTDAQARDYRTYFYYDSFHRLGQQSSPKSTQHDRGNLVWSAAKFDPNDNLVTQFTPAFGAGNPGLGAPTTMTYNAMDRRLSRTGPESDRTEWEYDAANRVTKVIRPNGTATATVANDFATIYAYDALDRVVTQTQHNVRPDGTVIESLHTHACYDNAGNLVSVTSPRANKATITCGATGSAEPFTTKYTYDDAHRRLTVTDPLNHVRKMAYDANSNVISTTNESNHVSTRDYDARNLLTRVIQPYEEGVGRKVKTAYRYDAVGNKVKVISPRAWDASPDAEPNKQNFSRYVTTIVYDDVNRVERVELPFSNVLPEETGFQQQYVHKKYDKNGRLVRTSLPVTSLAPPADAHESWTVVTHWDPGWVKTSKTAPNPIVHFDYEAPGWQKSRIPEMKDSPDTKNMERAMSWTYYPDGTLKTRTDQDGGGVSYEYDLDNNVKSIVDDSGISGNEKRVEMKATYDSLDRRIEIRHRKAVDVSDTTTNYTATEYAYDLNGNLIRRVDDATAVPGSTTLTGGKTSTFTYDAANWLDVQIDKGKTPNDCTDDRKIDNDFTVTGWEQQRANHKALGTCTTDPVNGWQLKQQTNWTYFQNGKLDTLITKQRDDATATMKVVESHDLSYLSDQGFYVNGHRTKDVYSMDGPDTTAKCRPASPCTRKFVYDPRDRLVKEDDGHSGVTSYTLDPAGNVTREAKGTATIDYSYTANQLTQVQAGSNVNKYFYDDYGNLDCVTGATGVDTDCSKSAQGSPATGVLSDYAYDDLNRMTNYRSFASDDNTNTDYSYDGLDRVIKEVEDHGSGATTHDRTTAFSYQGLTGLVTQEQITGTTAETKSYSYDAYGNRVSMQHQKGTTTDNYNYAYDVHGSVSMLLKEAGGARASYGYTAYGKSDAAVSANDENAKAPLNPFRFTADRFDSGSGSIDMGARRFGPDVGRFLQFDVFAGSLSDLSLSIDPLTQNRYSFAGGNPISFVEFDGHMVIADGGGGAASDPNPTGDSGDGSSDGDEGFRLSKTDVLQGVGEVAEEATNPRNWGPLADQIRGFGDDADDWLDNYVPERYADGFENTTDAISDGMHRHSDLAGKASKYLGWAGTAGDVLEFGGKFKGYYDNSGGDWGEAATRTGLEFGGSLAGSAAVTAACAAAGVATAGIGAVACVGGAWLASEAGEYLGKELGEWWYEEGGQEMVSDAWNATTDAVGDAVDAGQEFLGDAADVASDVGDTLTFWD
ncbi:MAG TPA: DNRLRE domain-containing protein [Actinomycetota bacterium]|nr:DNRLRE domain-containing protein [Actinomycetota bacterium]